MIRIVYLLLVFNFYTNALPIELQEKVTCGYESCHPVKKGLINVHIIPHTHDDVGWLKTVDQYYFGSNTKIQNAGVQYILDSVVESLEKDPNRRFIYVETAFFWKWWQVQNERVKDLVRKFVNNGQLEFIGGGWSMNDEACVNYHSTIDQMTWGLRKLQEEFGECGRPKIGWQIDPFGHSKEQANIFAQLGFDAVFLGRIDYQDKVHRFGSRNAEMIWEGSSSLGNQSRIFTSVLFNNYAPPPGFCFDLLCDDSPMIDDKNSPDYNVDAMVDAFFNYTDKAAQVYTTDNILITMGEDFHYQYAEHWFKNLEKLIYYANKRQESGSKYNLIYSTPSCYAKAVYDQSKEENIKFESKTDDFFPYASDPHAYWTGYFSSRPTSKRFEREGNNYLQICKQLHALAGLNSAEDEQHLDELRSAMGIMQHHDAITGTEKEHVAHDYARILHKGITECEKTTSKVLSKLTNQEDLQYSSCLLLNISSCEVTEKNDNFVVTIYNPLSRAVNKYVRLPITGDNYIVTDPEGKIKTTQTVPIIDAILKTPGRVSDAKNELVFYANDVPALGFKSFHVTKSTKKPTPNANDGITGFGDVIFGVNKTSGLLEGISINNKELNITQELLYYEGFVGNNAKPDNRSSGAYIFRPKNQDAIKIAEKVAYKKYVGELVSEIHQKYSDWASQIIRVYNTEKYVEFDWIVGPIPKGEEYGKEVISRFSALLKNNKTFYTDSNGRELIERRVNHRDTWDLEVEEPVAGNYYPVTSKILIRDLATKEEVAILNDRSQGGTSLQDGQIELMVHRNCMHDDAFGVGEALLEEAYNEGLVARGSHYLITGTDGEYFAGTSLAAQEKDLAQRKLLDSWIFVAPVNKNTYNRKKPLVTQFKTLKNDLPDNIQILTFEPWQNGSYLLRLEHIYAENEDKDLSVPVTVNLQDIFSFQITSIKEATLGANQWLEDNKRLIFEDTNKQALPKIGIIDDDISIGIQSNHVKRSVQVTADNLQITLTPMQIRTFVIQISKDVVSSNV